MGLWVPSSALLTQGPPLLPKELQKVGWFCLFHLSCSFQQAASPLKGQGGLRVAECCCRDWEWAVVEHSGAVSHTSPEPADKVPLFVPSSVTSPL